MKPGETSAIYSRAKMEADEGPLFSHDTLTGGEESLNKNDMSIYRIAGWKYT